MTTIYHNRINGIKKSLGIWKSDLVSMYGEEFYTTFYQAYLDRENTKFFNHYLFNFNLLMILKIKKNISYIKLISIIINFLIKLSIKIFIPKILFNKKKIFVIKPTLKI